MAVPGARLRVGDPEGLRLCPVCGAARWHLVAAHTPPVPIVGGALDPVAGALTTLRTSISGALALIDCEGSELFIDEAADTVELLAR